MEEKLMSKKKPSFAVNERLNRYLAKHNRNTKIPVFYDDLLALEHQNPAIGV